MSKNLEQTVKDICKTFGNDCRRMMDIVTAVQKAKGCVSSQGMDLIAKAVKAKRVDVEAVVSFYAFLSKEKKGKTIIRVCNDVVDNMQGAQDVAKAFSKALGIDFGQTTADKKFTLEHAPCIGMCDQAPSALINNTVVTSLTASKVKKIVSQLQEDGKVKIKAGDGNNADVLVNSMVKNNIMLEGKVIFADRDADSGIKKALEMKPKEVIAEVKDSRLRGRGGAGFPTGLKWDFTSKAEGKKKYVLCNADEGEPGTFKDRVLLTEKFDLLFEGMTIAGYAIGADSGIIYLRAEYAYLTKFLNKKLEAREAKGLLGKNVLGKKGFSFNIRVQMGAGAYVCGEESALISSCEGLRGDPKNRPPFPAQKGYKQSPTTVNNVETFCSVSRILEQGASWYSALGTKGSAGTKLLSISGDCEKPGVYEVEFGITVKELLKMVEAKSTQAVLVAGPSGQIIGKDDFNKAICYDELATGGAIVIFNKERDLLKIVDEYMDFFVEESCGYCTPCRVGNVLMQQGLEKIMSGKGERADIAYLEELGETIKTTSRCGLGQTSPNPILTTIKNFSKLYNKKIKVEKDLMNLSFDIRAALENAEAITERKSVMYK